MSNKTAISRFSEVILSLGIPAIGYMCAAEKIDSGGLIWQIPVVLIAAWHVIMINDRSFGKDISATQVFFENRNQAGSILIPILILPVIYFSPLFGCVVFITMLNWDIYSLKGKRHWLTGLCHNFFGGALHLMIGISAAAKFADLQSLLHYWPEILFFAFTMTAGAMHHDSFDYVEDKAANYATGAVRFSPNLWWRLAVVPFITGCAMLPFCETRLSISFAISSIIYLLAYSFVALRRNPSSILLFRKVCRGAFMAGALIYTLKKGFIFDLI